MLSIVHTFCVVSCIVSGIYGGIIYYFFRDAKRMIWFDVLSICWGLCLLFCPYTDTSSTHHFFEDGDFSINLYLISLAFVVMFFNMYTSHSLIASYSKLNAIFNYLCLILACMGLVVKGTYYQALHCTIFIFLIIVFLYGFHIAIKDYRNGNRLRMYQIVAYGMLILSCLLSIILFITGELFFIPFMIDAPIFLVLHTVMMTKQYRVSTEKTKRLLSSLSETIEKINHSDDALLCTQMKSDFLYRSLDLIKEKCDTDPFTAEDLTVSLSKYLRHTLNFQQLRGIVPLNNEIELTKSFISIERQRNPKISYEYNFPNPLPDFHIPPLSIQPLVENAINHGFSGKEENPKIKITIMPYRDYYHIDVTDNGTGMDEETVNSLLETLNDSARIGVYSIHTRLTNLFGKGLVIQSAPGVGTSVSFVVPPDAIAFLKEREKEESDETVN